MKYHAIFLFYLRLN